MVQVQKKIQYWLGVGGGGEGSQARCGGSLTECEFLVRVNMVKYKEHLHFIYSWKQ